MKYKISITKSERESLMFIYHLYVVYPIFIGFSLLAAVLVLQFILELYTPTIVGFNEIKQTLKSTALPTLEPQTQQVAVPSININTANTPLDQPQPNKFWSNLTTVGCTIGLAVLVCWGIKFVSADPVDLATQMTNAINKNADNKAQAILDALDTQNNFVADLTTNQTKSIMEQTAKIQGKVTEILHRVSSRGTVTDGLNALQSIIDLEKDNK